MSRVAKCPIAIPDKVHVDIQGAVFQIKGSLGVLKQTVPNLVRVQLQDNILYITPYDDSRTANALAGTVRAQLNSSIIGVSQGFECQLLLTGVGYRAQLQDRKLQLNVGYSHPIVYNLPEGISVEIAEQTKITLRGADKQHVYQVAAEICRYRPTEPYKGKGIRRMTDKIRLKETKKK